MIKRTLKRLMTRGMRFAARDIEADIVLSAAEAHALPAMQDPIAYVEFLRTCIQKPCTHAVTEVKADSGQPDGAAKRFSMLIGHLRSGLPPIEYALAREIAAIADQNWTLSDSVEVGDWAGDTGLHFSISSSFGRKGRILVNVIRFMRSGNCLELGTAYGMSALFMLGALKRCTQIRGHLATVEGWPHLYSLSSSMLKSKYGESVSCHLGWSRDVLPELVKSLGKIDFMFHDGGHSAEDYV